MIETTKEGEDVEARGWQHAFGQLRICEILFFPLPHSIFYTKSIRSHRQSQRGRERLPPQQSDQYIFVSLSFSHQLQLQFRFQFQFQFHYGLWPLAAVQQADKVNRKPKIITMPAIINIYFDRLIVWSFFTWSSYPSPHPSHSNTLLPLLLPFTLML